MFNCVIRWYLVVYQFVELLIQISFGSSKLEPPTGILLCFSVSFLLRFVRRLSTQIEFWFGSVAGGTKCDFTWLGNWTWRLHVTSGHLRHSFALGMLTLANFGFYRLHLLLCTVTEHFSASLFWMKSAQWICFKINYWLVLLLIRISTNYIL